MGVSVPVYAQSETNIDSLKAIVEQAATPSEKAEALLVSAAATKYLDNEYSQRMAMEALAISKEIGDKEIQAASYFQLEQAYVYADEYEKALAYLDSAETIHVLLDNQSGIADVNDHRGNVLSFLGRYNEAYQHLLTALEIYSSIGDEDSANGTRILLGSTLDYLKEYERSIPLYEKAIDYYYSLPLARNTYQPLAFGLTYYGMSSTDMEQYAKSVRLYKQAEDLARQMNDEYGFAVVYSNLGWSFSLMGKQDSALYYCNLGLNASEKYGDIFGIEHNCKCLGRAYLQNGQVDTAEPYLVRAYKLSDTLGNLEEQWETRALLADLYEKKGDLKQSLQFLRASHTLNDSIYNIDQSRQLSFLQTNFDIAQKERENQGLQNELTAKTRQNNLSLLVIALTVAILGLIFWLWLTQRRHSTRLEEQVTERTQQLKESNERLLAANDELREFAYITSHDLKEPIRNISGFSTLANRRIEAGRSEEAVEFLDYINQSAKQLNTLVNDVYQFVKLEDFELSGQNIQLDPLLQNINKELNGPSAKKNFELSFQSDVQDIYTSAPLLRIVLKNLIENSIKYNKNGTPKIAVSCQATNGVHRFTVSDNGIGIPEEYHEQVFRMFKRLHNREQYEGSGLGLSICQKIVSRMGGQIKITESIIGQSTTIVFDLPKITETAKVISLDVGRKLS